MLFSGVAQCYECPNCGEKFSTRIPTSIVPLLIIVITAGMFWDSIVLAVIEIPVLALGVGLALGIGSYFLSFEILQMAMTNWARTKKCPICGGKLKGVAGGFVDGGIPSLQEVLAYAIVIGLPLCIWLLRHLLRTP
jgi:hypothetical protein